MLKVINIQRKVNKNGVEYAVVRFNQITQFGDKTVLSNRSTTRNLQDESILPDGSIIKADPLFTAIKTGEQVVGTFVDGEIKTVNTTEYILNDRSIKSYTGVVFGGENYLTLFNRHLRKMGAIVVNEHGELTEEIELPVRQHQEVN